MLEEHSAGSSHESGISALFDNKSGNPKLIRRGSAPSRFDGQNFGKLGDLMNTIVAKGVARGDQGARAFQSKCCFRFLGWILAEICIILVTNFQKLPSAGSYRPQRRLIFNISDPKLGDLTKLCFFQRIVTKSNFKKSVMTSLFVTSSPLRVPNDITKITSQSLHFGPPPIKISGYASDRRYSTSQRRRDEPTELLYDWRAIRRY